MIYLLVFLLMLATPVSAQLAAPMTGHFAQSPLVYYRVGFVSLNKRLSHFEILNLISNLEKDPIGEKYIFLPKQSEDKTYEVQMLMKIIFLDKHEAETAVEFLKQNTQFNTTKFNVEIVECKS